jgi:hypothetical protein
MRSAIPAQERPARNALIVELSCVNHMRRPVVPVIRSSARPVLLSTKGSTQSLQWPTGKIESEKELRSDCDGLAVKAPSDAAFRAYTPASRFGTSNEQRLDMP